LSRQDGVSELFARSADYAIRRAPDLMTVTPGAEVRYACQHRLGAPPASIGGTSSYRDGVRWYKFRARALLEETRGDPAWAVPIQRGPAGDFEWRCRWHEEPGRYVVGTEISGGGERTFCFLPQVVEAAGRVVGRSLDDLLAGGAGPTPAEAEQRVALHLATLRDIERRFPVAGGEERARHEQAVRDWKRYHVALRALLAPTEGKARIPLPAVHLETATQLRRPLLLFLCHVGDDVVGRAGRRRPRWVLVDWTDPSDSRWHGRHEGVGDDDGEAIHQALAGWDRDNRYPEGLVTYQIPAGPLGEAQRRRMPTDGKTLADEVQGIFEWVALGGLVVAGALLLFTPVPALASPALATSLLSSTAAAGISIGQRWRAGVFDWREDAFDGLTIVSALFAAGGAWARGARVVLLGHSGETLTRVFIGARVGADLVQGVLVAEESLREWSALTDDPGLLPDERARKLLALIRNLAASGLLTYVSLRAAASELAHLQARPRHVASAGEARPSGEKLAALTDPRATIDTRTVPAAEGHGREGRHRTVLTTHRVHPRIVAPEETEFAKFYGRERHRWRDRDLTKDEILLFDKDRFSFHAKCTQGTLSITIVTNVGPDSPERIRRFFNNPKERKFSEVLRASELYPRMYRYFEEVGNPVKKLRGKWAWDNYEDAKKEFDRLMGDENNKLTAAQAARRAVLHARSWIKYHQHFGFTQVTSARHDPEGEVFYFTIVKPKE
jgi:hypothetical protein